jgi:crossover junction endodeoxyribonuclease RuvC
LIAIGIDPGLTGAICVYTYNDIIAVHDMPVAARGSRNAVMAAALADILREWDDAHAFVESVHSMPGQGVASSFNFGHGCGVIDGVLSALCITTTLVTPQRWKKAMGLGAEKGQARNRAMQLFPRHAKLFNRAKDDGRAEAALIAVYGFQTMARAAA